MKHLKVTIFCLCFLSPLFAVADLTDDIVREPASMDDVVLDESFLQDNDWSEPTFSSQGRQRDLAAAKSSDGDQHADSIGELAVQREIPFTYPVVTRLTLQHRTLNEIEAQEAKKQ